MIDFKPVKHESIAAIMGMYEGSGWISVGGPLTEVDNPAHATDPNEPVKVLDGPAVDASIIDQGIPFTGDFSKPSPFGDKQTHGAKEWYSSQYFSGVKEIHFKADRPYTSSGSTKGPSVSGRVDMSNVSVTKSVDGFSAKIFEFCNLGKVFDQIDFINTNLHVRVYGSNVANYKCDWGRFIAPRFYGGDATLTFGGDEDGGGVQQGSKIVTSANETFELWYTAIEVKFHGVATTFDGSLDTIMTAAKGNFAP